MQRFNVADEEVPIVGHSDESAPSQDHLHRHDVRGIRLYTLAEIAAGKGGGPKQPKRVKKKKRKV